MPSRRHLLLVLAALAFSTFLSGCASESEVDNNTIPQARPADWQGGIPGLGTAFGGNTGGGNALH
jgi:ABC-type uncharacterized transport system auxiliary subunit